jgi:hypothetical protein
VALTPEVIFAALRFLARIDVGQTHPPNNDVGIGIVLLLLWLSWHASEEASRVLREAEKRVHEALVRWRCSLHASLLSTEFRWKEWSVVYGRESGLQQILIGA